MRCGFKTGACGEARVPVATSGLRAAADVGFSVAGRAVQGKPISRVYTVETAEKTTETR